jgi:CheY-like chemotaxis protein
VALCLAEVVTPMIQAFSKQASLGLEAKPITGAALSEQGRSPERLLSDAYGQLTWARATQQHLSWAHWRGGDGWGEGASAKGPWSASGEQVLIIDTDPTSADALRFACEREGLSVTGASSTKSALELLKRLPHPPALVIAECAPPQSDGLKLLQDIKTLVSGQPRVVLSVSARRGELLREAFEGGAMDVITKPFHMSEAIARVLYALQRAPLK